VSVRRALLPLLVTIALALTGCTPEPAWDIAADGSCDPAQLQVKVVPRVDDDPQLVAVDILLKNVSGTPCQLTGIPAVTITDAIDSKPIGDAAAALPGEPQRVDLAPQTVAYIYLHTLKSLADTATCVGVLANSTRILLPGRTDAQAIVTSAPVAKYCDEPARGTFLVSPITAKPLVVDGVQDFVPDDFVPGEH